MFRVAAAECLLEDCCCDAVDAESDAKAADTIERLAASGCGGAERVTAATGSSGEGELAVMVEAAAAVAACGR